MVYAGGFLKERPLPDKSKAYRPYKIFNSEHRILGNVAQIDQREGWFTTISYPMRRKTPCFSYGDIRRVHRIYASN